MPRKINKRVVRHQNYKNLIRGLDGARAGIVEVKSRMRDKNLSEMASWARRHFSFSSSFRGLSVVKVFGTKSGVN